MATKPAWRRRLLVPLLAAAAVALPLGLRADGSLGASEACAQTGCCYKDDNSCHFVNGVIYPGRWENC